MGLVMVIMPLMAKPLLELIFP